MKEKYDFLLKRVCYLSERINMQCLQTAFHVKIDQDKDSERVFIQLYYECMDSHEPMIKKIWKGRKWYLSYYMSDDEIVKTIYAAFEMAVKHEVMEGFKVDGKTLFNPHVDFEELLKISDREVKRL